MKLSLKGLVLLVLTLLEQHKERQREKKKHGDRKKETQN